MDNIVLINTFNDLFEFIMNIPCIHKMDLTKVIILDKGKEYPPVFEYDAATDKIIIKGLLR